MIAQVLLITPPFTQLNTPYPATAYLKGFLNTKNISSFQADLGIEVTNALFSRTGLQKIFAGTRGIKEVSENAARIISLQEEYIKRIDHIILFLQGKNPTLAHIIGNRDYLPEASRFSQMDDLDYAFGKMGIQDRAKHIATMFLEDISDFIVECVDPYFGFSRYAERLARSANSFDALYDALQQPYSLVDELLIESLSQKLLIGQPKVVALSVPFPGNLYSSLRCGQWIKKNYPDVAVIMGGGFANTELRSLTEKRVFEFYDFITLDDGEAPLENLLKYLNKEHAIDRLKRTYTLTGDKVIYINCRDSKDYKQGDVGTPDYSDMLLDKYISAIEVVNPMHRMWSDGRWNKLTMAHGCYWGKCTFCDISLDYIKLYEPVAANVICDRMEEIIKQTGESGFHFVDEAAPPALMKAVALEIIKRGLTVSWWTNIRFEKNFTADACLLLKASGCIAVSGGLEVASDRLLKLIQKGITVAQVARVNKNFTDAGIMVHAYLMYGFPGQTAQETIDSLEMVRQLFSIGILQSAFWHQFAMTAHSPVGMNPEIYGVKKLSGEGSFANNDIVHSDSAADHDAFTFGLKKSLHNYMHNIGFDIPLNKWFDHKVPKTSVSPDFIHSQLHDDVQPFSRPDTKIVWLGKKPVADFYVQSKKGNQREMAELKFTAKRTTDSIHVPAAHARWLMNALEKVSVMSSESFTLQKIKDDYDAAGLEDFELFWDNKPVTNLNKFGLLRL